MANGSAVKFGGKIIRQGERVVAAAVVALVDQPFPCNRVWVGTPTANHPKGSGNTGNILVGRGRATVTLAGLPADGDTVTINDGNGNKVFEFDSNGAITGGNIAVTIGADTTSTLDNLVRAIHTQRAMGFRVDAYRDTTTVAVVFGVTAISDASANATAVVNRGGDLTLATANNAGVFLDVDDARDVILAGFNAGDAVEFAIYG